MGCKEPKVINSGYCAKHGGVRSNKHLENKKLYGSAQWQKMRIAKLSQFPLCASCLMNGIVRESEHIDHVFPHNRDRMRFSDNLFQGLCPACHTQKTKLESKGVYRHYKPDLTGYVDYSEMDYEQVMRDRYGDLAG